MQARLIRGFVAMPFTYYSPADASSHRLADDVNGGVLRYMAPAMEPEQAAYSLSPPLSGAFLADPDPMLVRLIRGFIAMALSFAARVLTKTGMQLHGASDCMRASRVQLADQATVHCPG